MPKQSLSEKALQYLQTLQERNYDFTSKYNRKTARQGFIDNYNLDQKKGSDIFNHAFPKFLRKNRLKKKDFLETRLQKPKDSDMTATIKPKPQSCAFEKSPVDIVNEEVQQQQESQQVQTQPQIKNEHIAPEAVEASFDGILIILKFWWPLEDLTKEEKETLGRMWLPTFQRYLNEHWAYIGLPLIAAIGIFGRHIIKARRIKKENQLKAIEEEKEIPE